MKQINLSKAEGRILSQQITAKTEGFTIKQLRLLDKIDLVFDSQLTDYNKPIDDMIEKAKEEIKENPDDKNVQLVNATLNENLDAYTETEGIKSVTFLFEDEQFNFIKEIWEASGGFKGDKKIRKYTLSIDDAIQAVIDVPTTEAKKNETPPAVNADNNVTPAAETGN